MSKTTTKEAIDWAVQEWTKAQAVTPTHRVINNNGDVEHEGTRESCKIFIAANGPLAAWSGISYHIRKIK